MQGSLTIDLEPYTLTNDDDCGEIIYSASVTSGYDPFSAGYATNTEGSLVFSNFQQYEEGTMTVFIDILQVRQDVEIGVAYSLEFDIDVIQT